MSTSHSQKTGCRCDAKTVSNASQPDHPDGLAALSNTGMRTTLSVDISLRLWGQRPTREIVLVSVHGG